ncbi:MAG: hypothetical protein FWG04_03465 [Desulfovibrionaceae bacterium]|nr:hypothetical protein [Desulfovibrionaceae bacterium]
MRSPVLFMIFKRPETTARVFQAIREARPPRLYIAADGPRPDRPGEDGQCELARKAATAVDWDCDVKTLFRKKNLGCAVACSSAITWFFQQEREGIILEDDVLPHPDFFSFCDHMLDYYRDDPRIFQVSASNFQMGIKRGKGSYYFSWFNHIWGWATWARAWRHYDHSMQGLTRFIKEDLPHIFPYPPAARYFSDAFIHAKANNIPTWAFRWFFATLKQKGLTILPNHNLARNIGFDADGTTCTSASLWDHVETGPMQEIIHPDRVEPDAEADRLTDAMVFTPQAQSLESLFQEGWRRLETGLAYSNYELLRMARGFHGDAFLLDCLEAATHKATGRKREALEMIAGLRKREPDSPIVHKLLTGTHPGPES